MSDYESQGRFRRGVRLLITHRLLASISLRVLPSIDDVILHRTGGRWTFSGWLTGLPVVELGTIGARSGQSRWSPVMAVPVEGQSDARLIAAANFGAQQHPAWYHNVLARPTVTIRDHGQTRTYDAVELHGDARDQAFARMLQFNPGWSRFQARAGQRGIPVIRLDPTRPETLGLRPEPDRILISRGRCDEITPDAARETPAVSVESCPS